MTTAEMINKTTRAWELSLNLGVEGGVSRYVGTRYDDADTYQAIIDRGVAESRIYKATSDGKADGPPVLMSEPYLAEKRAGMSPEVFSAQMLLDPVPETTAFFKKEYIRWYDEPPKHLNKYGASDYAVTEGGGDWTEHGVIGVDPNDDMYLLDWWRGQTAADTWIEEQLDLIRKHKPQLWVGESGPIRRAVEPFLEKRMQERRDYCALDWLPSVRDKPTRSRAFQARMAQGKVYLPNLPWAHELLRQLLRFPHGAVDDGVDVCSLFGRILDQTYRAGVPEKRVEKKTNRWDRAFARAEHADDSWKVHNPLKTAKTKGAAHLKVARRCHVGVTSYQDIKSESYTT